MLGNYFLSKLLSCLESSDLKIEIEESTHHMIFWSFDRFYQAKIHSRY